MVLPRFRGPIASGLREMSKNSRVTIYPSGFRLRFNQAQRAVNECSCAWIEFGVSLRMLTHEESIAARNEQARLAEPMPFAEIPGLIYEPSMSGNAATRAGYALIRQANALVMV